MSEVLPAEFPYVIETMDQCDALGVALNQVLHFDTMWARRVFENRGHLTYQTGPSILNKELREMWARYWTPAEKRQIMTIYTHARLVR